MFGSIETVNNKQIMTGGSGINIADLIKVKLTLDQKNLDKLNSDVELNNKILTSYSEYTGLLNEFKKASNLLRNPTNIYSNTQSDSFKSRIISINSNDEVNKPARIYTSVRAYAGTPKGKYTLEINNLAQAKLEVYSGFTSDSSDVVLGSVGFFTAGTFQINGENVTLEDGDSLKDIAQKINNLNSSTKTTATIQKISENNFTLRISSDNTGIENSYEITDTENVLTQLTVSETRNALDSSFIFNNQLTSRPSNVISDLLGDSNLEISLFAETNGTVITIDISDDTKAVQEAIIDWMNKYNDIMRFAFKQTEFDFEKGQYKETAILAREYEFTSSIMLLKNLVNSRVGGLEIGASSCLADLGIVIADLPGNPSDPKDTPIKGALQFKNSDISVLDLALSRNLDEVRRIFSFDFLIDSLSLILTQRTNNHKVNNFSLDIDLTRPKISINGNLVQDKVRIIIDSKTIRPNYKDGIISGLNKTELEGIKLFYNGDGSDLINVKMTQGIADRAFNIINELIGDSNEIEIDDLLSNNKQYDDDGNVIKKKFYAKGTINLAIENTTSKNSRTKQNIEDLNEKMERKRESLLKEYGENEAKIRKLNNIQQSLKDHFRVQFSDK